MKSDQHVGNGRFVIPVVRHAIRSDIVPSPTVEQAMRYGELLGDDWREARQPYFEQLAASSQGTPPEIYGKDQRDKVRHGHAGSTVTVDYPQVVGNAGDGLPYSARLRVTISTGDESSKSIARVGLPFDHDSGTYPSLLRDGFSDEVGQFGRIAREMAIWGHERIQQVLGEEVGRVETKKYRFEVVTIGAHDERLEPHFDRLRYADSFGRDILSLPDAEGAFMEYFSQVASVESPLSQHTTRHPDDFWFVLPVPVEIEEVEGHYMEQRQVLYLMTSSNGTDLMIGLGYDDSIQRDLAPRSSGMMERWWGALV